MSTAYWKWSMARHQHLHNRVGDILERDIRNKVMLDQMLKLGLRARVEVHFRKYWESYLIALSFTFFLVSMAYTIAVSFPFIPA